MKTIRFISVLVSFCALFLLAGCGSDSSTDSTLSGGIAVDPYISGAVFQEIGTDGSVLQESLPSDAQGRFTFPEPLTQGSVIEMKTGAQGIHNGKAFQGTLKRKVDAEGLLVASPLTTLLANGFTVEEVLALLGIEGLQESDLTADPMAGLDQVIVTGTETVDSEELRPLRANVAANALMAAMQKRGESGYAVTPEEVDRTLMADIAAGMELCLYDILQEVQVANDLPVTLVEVAHTAEAVTAFMMNEMVTDPTADPRLIVQDLKASGAISDLVLANAMASHRQNMRSMMTSLSGGYSLEIAPGDTFSLDESGCMVKNSALQ